MCVCCRWRNLFLCQIPMTQVSLVRSICWESPTSIYHRSIIYWRSDSPCFQSGAGWWNHLYQWIHPFWQNHYQADTNSKVSFVVHIWFNSLEQVYRNPFVIRIYQSWCTHWTLTLCLFWTNRGRVSSRDWHLSRRLAPLSCKLCDLIELLCNITRLI